MTTTTLDTAAPTFHALTGRQPVGQVQIATQAEFTGTLTSVRRCNDTYWIVVTRAIAGAFTDRRDIGASCSIWLDPTTMEFVVGYWDGPHSVEADRTRTLGAAIGSAVTVTARRWLEAR